MSTSPYAGLRVLEVASDIAGEHTGKLLAQLGATVTKLEPEGGSPTRQIGPFEDGADPSAASLTFRFYNENKLLAGVPQGRSVEDEVAARLPTADVLLIDWPVAALESLGMHDGRFGAHPRLITLTVTPFGLSGPWADYRSTDLTALAGGGPLAICGYDDHSIPPIRPGGNQAHHTASSFAHLGLLVALLELEATGEGQLVDVSMHESLAVTVEAANPYWFYSKTPVIRQTCRQAQPKRTQPSVFESLDGKHLYFTFIVTERKPFAQLVRWMETKGVAADLADERFQDPATRQREYAHIQGVLEAFFLIHDAETLFREGQSYGLPIGILAAPEEVLLDGHLIARGSLVQVDQPNGQSVLVPRSPFRITSIDMPKPVGPRPATGEDAPGGETD